VSYSDWPGGRFHSILRDAGLHLRKPPIVCFAAGFLFLLITHIRFLDLPYHWDELGYFVPAAHDLLHWHSLIPRSTLPNVHPPLLMLYLAGVWMLFGFQIPATRVAMLGIGAATLAAIFALARRLSGSTRAACAAAFLAALSPPFVIQSMLAQLDLAAALWCLLSLYFFLERRPWRCGAAATALVLTKETGLLVPMALIAFSLHAFWQNQKGVWNSGTPKGMAGAPAPVRAWCSASFPILPLLPPFGAIAVWLLFLRSKTGHWFGNSEFAAYNLARAFDGLRILLVFLRRCYQLGISDFHWIGTALLALAILRYGALRGRRWKLVLTVIAGYVLLHSAVGGAVLLRYLLPAVALFYIAVAAASELLPAALRRAGLGTLAAGLVISNWWNPPYPFSYEDNLAVVDFIRLQQRAAQWLTIHSGDQTVTTAWPLTDALVNPLGGYVRRPLKVNAVENFQPEALRRVSPEAVQIFVLYSRSWDPPGGVQGWPPVAELLRKYFGYTPQITSDSLEESLHLRRIAGWQMRGQWMEILGR
jgi:uncharacterized protein YjeT (DUF2065 family)